MSCAIALREGDEASRLYRFTPVRTPAGLGSRALHVEHLSAPAPVDLAATARATRPHGASPLLRLRAPRGKAFHEDVVREGYVAIVGQTHDYRTCRLRGPVSRPEDAEEQRALVDAIFELNPSMNLIYPGDARYICDVFCIAEGEGEYFDLGQKPIFRKPFMLGGDARCDKGTFLVTDACIGCGTCAEKCPEECIASGTPYEIDQSHCLRCGICFECCPVQAIVKR